MTSHLDLSENNFSISICFLLYSVFKVQYERQSLSFGSLPLLTPSVIPLCGTVKLLRARPFLLLGVLFRSLRLRFCLAEPQNSYVLDSTPHSVFALPGLVGLSGLEPPTSRLSGVRSNRLSYKPMRLISLCLINSPKFID